MRTVIAVRAHEPSEAVRSLVRQLSGPDGPHVLVVVDDLNGRAGTLWSGWSEVVPVNRALLRKHGLRDDISDAGWRCGDYFYYALLEVLEWDFAWLVEPDVAFAGLEPLEFFAAFASFDTDLLAADIRRVGSEGWEWQGPLLSRGVEDIWACFFPLTRLSRRATEASLDFRRSLESLGVKGGPEPNDESVVATAVARSGLSMLDLRAFNPTWFAQFNYAPKVLREALEMDEGVPGVAHSVLGWDDFLADLTQSCRRLRFRSWKTMRWRVLGQFAAVPAEWQQRVYRALPLDVRGTLAAYTAIEWPVRAFQSARQRRS